MPKYWILNTIPIVVHFAIKNERTEGYAAER